MTVDPNDLIGRHIYLTGKFDRTVFSVLSKFARPGDTLLDIGANIGYVCGCFLQNVPQSKVIAVEPQPIIVNQLASNLQQFGDGRYSVYPWRCPIRMEKPISTFRRATRAQVAWPRNGTHHNAWWTFYQVQVLSGREMDPTDQNRRPWPRKRCSVLSFCRPCAGFHVQSFTRISGKRPHSDHCFAILVIRFSPSAKN